MYAEVLTRVEAALKTLGIEPEEAKTGEGQYSISKDGEVEILIDVWDDSGKSFFQVMSPLTGIKVEDEKAFFKKLLEENHSMAEAAFTYIEEQLFIRQAMECSVFFSQERVITLINRIAWYSEHYHGLFRV